MNTLNLETIKLIGNGVLDAKHVSVLLQADMLAEEAAVDPIQMNRVCAILTDAQELLVKGDKKSNTKGLNEIGKELVRTLHPQEYESGKQFDHEGCTYYVETKRTPILKDQNGNPYQGADFDRIQAIDRRKDELARKQKELTKQRNEAIDKLVLKHPYLQMEVKRILKVVR
jgi:hypothetical protein